MRNYDHTRAMLQWNFYFIIYAIQIIIDAYESILNLRL